MHPLTMVALSAPGWITLLMLAGTCLVGMAFTHSGSLDQSALMDIANGEALSASAAVTASGTFPANALTGAGSVIFTNTTNTPGTLTTRTAAQMFADLTAQLGFQPPNGYQWLVVIVHAGTGTLTVAAGTGVTLSSLSTGPTTIATVTSRMYVMTMVNPQTFTMQAVGALAT